MKQFFAETKDVQRIIKNLSLVYGQRITPHDTLIIFDEIQECSEALGTLKYFCEKAPEYDIVSAGSLLGVALTKGRAFPVGKVDFLDIFPITFSEFLASSSPQLADYIKSIQIIESLPDIFLNQLLEQFKIYWMLIH